MVSLIMIRDKLAGSLYTQFSFSRKFLEFRVINCNIQPKKEANENPAKCQLAHLKI